MRSTGRLMPKKTRTWEPISRDASNSTKLLIATPRARVCRSAGVLVWVRPRNSGAQPSGLITGNRAA